jgi:hypothetical protein
MNQSALPEKTLEESAIGAKAFYRVTFSPDSGENQQPVHLPVFPCCYPMEALIKSCHAIWRPFSLLAAVSNISI